MAAQPTTAGRRRRAMLCALLVLIASGSSVSFAQMPPQGPALGGPGWSAPAMPMPSNGPTMPMPPNNPAVPMPPGGPMMPMAGSPPPAANVPPQISPPLPYMMPMAGSPLPAAGPALPLEENVVDVLVEGNRTITRGKILAKIRTRPNRPYLDQQVEQDVRELYKMGVFADVHTFKQRVQGGVVVIFRVAERPLLQEVIIVGNATFLTSTLKTEAELKKGDAADPFAVENGRRKIEDFYHKKGYPKVRVTVLEGNKAGDLRAIFVVDEGPQQKIFWVNFVGNQFVSTARLKTLIESHPPWFYLFAGEVDRKQIDEDVDKLTAYYRGFGFFHAHISRLLEFNEKQNWLTITFVIDEGPRYSIRSVALLGNKRLDNARLNAKLKLLSGQPFDQNQQNLDLQKLRDEYGGDGYVFAKIEADNRFLEEPGKLDIVYNVDEGARYKVGRINIEIKGENPHTQITTVLNRLSFRPGDIADIREFHASERRLKAAQLFKNDPQKQAEPKVVYSPPDDDRDSAVAGQRRTTYYRVPGGEAPLPPGEAYLDLDVSAEPQRPEPTPLDAACVPAPCPQLTFLRTTFQPSVYANQVSPAQAYAAPPAAGQASLAPAYSPQVPQPHLRSTRYEPTDGWTPQQQGQSWPAAANGGNGAYAPQPQSYAVQQTPPATAPMYYNPPPAAPGPAYPYAANAAAPAGYAPSGAPAVYTPAGPAANRPVAEMAAAGDLFSNPEPMMVPNPNTDPLQDVRVLPPIRIPLEETQTGRLMFGVGVNSDAGLVGNITLDEQNFDWTKVPESWEDVMEGRAFRGAGERFRLELVPGTQVQRYMVTFQEPYLDNRPVSLGLSGFFYQRIYPEWTESRAGGSVSFGYQFTHDLTGSVRFQGQNVDIKNPAYPVPDLLDVVGHNQLYSAALSLQHDTRDNPFLASEGHLVSGTIEENFGSFQFPRASVEFSQFFRIFERADRSGKNVLSLSLKAGYSGDDTPIFERYYAGGFSTIRGFAFRGVTPRDPVYHMGVGGDFQMLSTAQYLFPITADDMLRGVVFVDAGTVEPTITQWVDKVRVAPGFGLRISIPMMGPAPIALDFAFPVCQQNGDQTQIFSFFVGFNH